MILPYLWRMRDAFLSDLGWMGKDRTVNGTLFCYVILHAMKSGFNDVGKHVS